MRIKKKKKRAQEEIKEFLYSSEEWKKKNIWIQRVMLIYIGTYTTVCVCGGGGGSVYLPRGASLTRIDSVQSYSKFFRQNAIGDKNLRFMSCQS